MDIKQLKNISDLKNIEEITVNGQTLQIDELTQRTILVKGAQPTDYEQWQFIDVLVDLRNKKADAGGTAQAIYRYGDHMDMHKFNQHQYPYKLNVLMADTVDKKGDVVQEIVYADFANATEMQLVPRTNPQSQSKPKL